MNDNIFIQCQACQETVPDIGKYCSHCGAYFTYKNEHIDNAEISDQTEYYIYQAAEEIIESGGKITQNEIGRIIVTGAAATALVGLSVVGVTASIIAGIGKGAFQHLRGNNRD